MYVVPHIRRVARRPSVSRNSPFVRTVCVGCSLMSNYSRAALVWACTGDGAMKILSFFNTCFPSPQCVPLSSGMQMWCKYLSVGPTYRRLPLDASSTNQTSFMDARRSVFVSPPSPAMELHVMRWHVIACCGVACLDRG